jgi:hypothetical protein
MIENYTVLVLGAGASAPFGFPTGQGLKDRVCDTILRSPQSVNTLKSLGFNEEKIAHFRAALTNSGRSSVDAFLEYREDFLDIGKAAIALTILPYETTSRLFKDWIHKGSGEEGNWYDLLFSALTDGVPFDDVDKNSISIITFNYDRSLEHYLFTSLKNSYNKTDDECADKLRKIHIIHVHGSLGPLDWQSHPAVIDSVPYNSGTTQQDVKLATKNIRIVHESEATTPEFQVARHILPDSKTILFLGFGFHPVNLKRLGIGTINIPHDNIKGTSLGLSQDRKQNIGNLIPILTGQRGHLFPKNIYTFLHDHISFSK